MLPQEINHILTFPSESKQSPRLPSPQSPSLAVFSFVSLLRTRSTHGILASTTITLLDLWFTVRHNYELYCGLRLYNLHSKCSVNCFNQVFSLFSLFRFRYGFSFFTIFGLWNMLSSLIMVSWMTFKLILVCEIGLVMNSFSFFYLRFLAIYGEFDEGWNWWWKRSNFGAEFSMICVHGKI